MGPHTLSGYDDESDGVVAAPAASASGILRPARTFVAFGAAGAAARFALGAIAAATGTTAGAAETAGTAEEAGTAEK